MHRNLEDEKRILNDERAKRFGNLLENKQLLLTCTTKDKQKAALEGVELTRYLIEKDPRARLEGMKFQNKDVRLNEQIDEIEEMTSRQIAGSKRSPLSHAPQGRRPAGWIQLVIFSSTAKFAVRYLFDFVDLLVEAHVLVLELHALQVARAIFSIRSRVSSTPFESSFLLVFRRASQPAALVFEKIGRDAGRARREDALLRLRVGCIRSTCISNDLRALVEFPRPCARTPCNRPTVPSMPGGQ